MGLCNINEERVHSKKEVGLSIVKRGERRYIFVGKKNGKKHIV